MTAQRRARALLLSLACASCTSSAAVGRLAEIDAELPDAPEVDAERPDAPELDASRSDEDPDAAVFDAARDAFVSPADASSEAGAPDASADCVDEQGCGAGRMCSGGACVQCVVDDDCVGQEEPRCDARGRCVECRSTAECSLSSQVCAPWGECELTCTRDSQCLSTLRCDPNFVVCLECVEDADCSGSGEFCDEGICSRCAGNPDCPN